MTSLFLRNLFFTILQPGLVAGLFPYLLARDKIKSHFDSMFGITQYAGMILFVFGWMLTLYCIYRFAVEGKGTLSPADPTKNLVMKGIYRYSRNPMYIGVVIALLGMTFFSMSWSVTIYTAIIFIAFNLFIRFVEEPRLEKDFGPGYLEYKRSVRRWI